MERSMHAKIIIVLIMISMQALAARFETNIGKDIVQSVTGNAGLHCMLNKSSNILEIGKEFDQLTRSTNGSISAFSCSFYVKDIKDIYSFTLNKASFKDYILVKVNGNFIWSSTSLQSIAIDYNKTFEEEVKDNIKL